MPEGLVIVFICALGITCFFNFNGTVFWSYLIYLVLSNLMERFSNILYVFNFIKVLFTGINYSRRLDYVG